MGIYNHLPIYKTSYNLLIDFFCLTKNFSREYKWTIGERIKNEVIELVINVYRSNSSSLKVEQIQKARENVEIIRLFLRLLKDLKQINLKRFISLNEQIESASKQLAAWQKASKR